MWSLSDKIVIAKKRKRCAWCAESCEVGEKRHNRTYVFDGDFQSDSLHLECYDAMGESDLDEDGFRFGEMKRGKTMEESDL